MSKTAAVAEETTRGDRLIFVGGAGRSGTTLVQNILDSHPDVCGGPEFLHIPEIMRLREDLHQSIRNEWIDFYCTHDRVDSLISKLIEDFLLPMADQRGCRHVSEKTTENVLVFGGLMELFPGALFVHVVRDPRGTIASLLRVGRKARQAGWEVQDYTHRLSRAISYLRESLVAGFEAAQRGPERVHTMVFERLVRDPRNETYQLCEFLGLPWSELMLRPGQMKHPGEKAITRKSSAPGIWYDEERYYRDPDPSEIEKWRGELSAVQQVVITGAFRDIEELRQLGYDLSVNGYKKPLAAMVATSMKLPLLPRLVRRLF